MEWDSFPILSLVWSCHLDKKREREREWRETEREIEFLTQRGDNGVFADRIKLRMVVSLLLPRPPARPILTENRKFAKLEVIAQRRGWEKGAAAERISICGRREESGESNWLSGSKPAASKRHKCHRWCLNSLQRITHHDVFFLSR